MDQRRGFPRSPIDSGNASHARSEEPSLTHYPLVPVPCNHCRGVRQQGLVTHQPNCPLDPASVLFFAHPDLMELDAHLTAFYPEA